MKKLLITSALAFALGYYINLPPEEHGYTQQERAEMDALVAFAIPQQEVVLYRRPTMSEQQASVLHDLYGNRDTTDAERVLEQFAPAKDGDQ